MQEIISKLNEFLEGGSVSMSALARALGISPGAISQFRAGKYKGDNAAIAAKISAYIDASAKKAKEFAASREMKFLTRGITRWQISSSPKPWASAR